MEIQTVIEIIKNLTKKTTSNGCTEGEALAAAIKIGDLLKVFNLSMDKIFLGEAKCVTGEVSIGGNNRKPVDSCVVTIGEFCDCRVWFSRGMEGKYCFFGLETDVEMAKYLYGIISSAIDTETIKFKLSPTYIFAAAHRKRLSTSFQRGMAARIHHRLKEMMEQRKAEEDEEQQDQLESTGTSLVIIKTNKIEDEFERLNLGLKKYYRTTIRYNPDAYLKGQSAGDKVNLNRPVGGQTVRMLT
jgi:hypothetical protein